MDFLGHLIDAPLANILIIAGLAFLGIAIVGKISGKIEPSNSGRLMSGVFGLVLLIYAIYAHSVVDKAQTQARTPPKSQQQPVRGTNQRESRQSDPPPALFLANGKTTIRKRAELPGWKFNKMGLSYRCTPGALVHHKIVTGERREEPSAVIPPALPGIKASCFAR